ncbi:hypothetical protein BEQ56_09065 [Anaerolineaceae bacterium oral taxon 439]|nr:hypothetical protein BEQ56_09065 [Anaerolineaceae bacterium oral taxon 439]
MKMKGHPMKKRTYLIAGLKLGVFLILFGLMTPTFVKAQTVVPTPAAPLLQNIRLRLQNPTVVPPIPQPTQTPYVIVVTATPNAAQTPHVLPDDLVARKAYDCAVNVNKPYFYQQFYPGEDFDFDVTFTNTGTQPWSTDVDVQQYTGWRMEIEKRYTYDIDKDYDSARIVYPGQSIRWKIRMEAPKDESSENGKYYSTYYLVHGVFNNNIEETYSRLFCPFSVYIYVPHK